MNDTYKAAEKKAQDDVYGAKFKCTSYMAGLCIGEWLIVDENAKQACIVNLRNDEIEDGINFDEVMQKYAYDLSKVAC